MTEIIIMITIYTGPAFCQLFVVVSILLSHTNPHWRCAFIDVLLARARDDVIGYHGQATGSYDGRLEVNLLQTLAGTHG